MAKHSTDRGTPTTGNGRTGGQKPQRTQVQITTRTGTILWRATASLFKKKGRKK